MSHDMLGPIPRALVRVPDEYHGTLLDVVNRLGATDVAKAATFVRDLKLLLRSGQTTQVAKPKPSLLKLVGTVNVPATTTSFIVKTKFVVDTKPDAEVKISGIGSNFEAYFLSGNGKIEDPIAAQTLHHHRLLKDSQDNPIIKELGGKAKAETTLTEMYSLMKMQRNGYTNIFYVNDQNGVLRAVIVYWSGEGWSVHAFAAPGLSKWLGGSRVFSRNVLEPCVPGAA